MDDQYIDSLLPETREMLERDDEDRIHYILQERWIPYPRAQEVLDKLEMLLKRPTKTRMPCLLIVGESNNGKSSIVKHFRRNHPPSEDLNEDTYPVFYLESCPPEPDEKRLYDDIFRELAIPFRYRDAASQKTADLLYYFKKLGTRMLILDEIHHSLSGSVVKQRVFMNALKNLNNLLSIPVVLVGTMDALYVTSTDKQIYSRFKPEKLQRWEKIDRPFVQFLADIEATLPLRKPSNLATADLAPLIHERAKTGCVGDFIDLVSEAAVLAIRSGKERISEKELKSCEFIPSSNRETPQSMASV